MPSTAAKGIPCRLPEGVVYGACRSACASIHITPKVLSGKADFIPLIVPIADEWSPENTSGNFSSNKQSSTDIASSLHCCNTCLIRFPNG
ncbi:hypothetical protein D3C85_1475970 [compost metagenome]